MNEKELKELIKYNDEYESKLALPNELFKWIKTMVSQGKLKPAHCGFVWSYIYFMTYLFRYAKWYYIQPTTSEIKSILGYTPTNKTLDYIIKQNGLLEQEDILTTIDDFVAYVEREDGELVFGYVSELYNSVLEFRKERKIGNRVKCKYPVFGFEEEYGATFYNSEYTTMIDFNVFARCMSDKELGVNTFYIYSWLKHMNDINDDYKTTRKILSGQLNMSEGTLHKYLDVMRSYRIVDVIYNMDYFSKGWKEDEREASSYSINDYSKFTYEKVEYNKLRFVSEQTHSKLSKVDDHELFA